MAEKLITELRKIASGWTPVDGVNERMVGNALDLIKDAATKGCQFVVGGATSVRPSALQPSVLTQVTDDMSIFDSESFGPSVCLFTVATEDEAVKLANNTTYGLNAAVHSQDIGRALRVARQLECGTVWVNGMTVGELGAICFLLCR